MSRTPEQVAQSMIATIEAKDNTIDVQKGFVFSFAIQPVSQEISNGEQQVEHLSKLYSLDFADAATEDEVTALANNYSIAKNPGKSARSVAQFFRHSQPIQNQQITIPAGTLVSNPNAQLVYQTITDAVIDGSNPDAYYNPSTNRWEINVTIEAQGTGEDYNIPAGRINRVITPVSGIDGATNIIDASGGASEETKDQQVARIQDKFNGLDSGVPSGFIAEVKDFSPQVIDVSLVKPKDRKIFRRITDDPAQDIYVSGESLYQYEQIHVVTETKASNYTIILDNPPVRSIDSIIRSNSAVAYDFEADTSLAFKLSGRANDKIIINELVAYGEILTIAYTSNKLIVDLQGSYSGRLFGTDQLLREPWKVYLDIYAEVVATSSTAATKVRSDVESQLYLLVQSEKFLEALFPEIVTQQIRSSVANLIDFRFRRFKRKTGSLFDVEIVEFEANEISVIDNTLLKIVVLS